MSKLLGKVAIVTGAASGIGRASAIAFAREGAKVVVADWNEQGQQTVNAIIAEGGEAFFVKADVAKESDIRRMIEDTIALWQRIDILFNNAGVVMVKPLEQMTEDEWDRVMAINVKGAFLAIKHAVPHIRRIGGGGAILNTGSIGSFTGQLGTPVYSASKGAIALLTKSLALDYGRDRIRVNCICPGITDTAMLREHMGHEAEGEANIRARLSRVPTGEILSPEDVARAALYLVSDDSKGITGILHVIDGGLIAASEYNIPL